MKTLFAMLFKYGQLLGTLTLSVCAVLALIGFITPLLDAFNHLQPIWFVGTLVSLILAWLLYKKSAFRSVLTSVAMIGLLASSTTVIPEAMRGLWNSSLQPNVTDAAKTYKILTHNLFALNTDMPKEAAQILAQEPDFVTLQEYFAYQRKFLHPLLVDELPYFLICVGPKRGNLGFYSRHPFAEGTQPDCSWDASERIARISAEFTQEDAPTFTVMTTHLDWPVQVNPLFRDLPLTTRLALMTKRKTDQFEDLTSVINAISTPLILTGDFNSTSWSYGLRTFVANSGLTRQTKSLMTFPRSLYIFGWRQTPAFLPLDHVMTKGDMIIHDIGVLAETKSDHSPVVTTFSVPAKL